MKKLLLSLLLIITLTSICAKTASLAFIEATKAPGELYQQALALQNQGVQIYYYNQAGFLVALESAKNLHPSQTITATDYLYLVSSPDGSLPQLPPDAGKPILKLGNVILLETHLDEVALRQKIRYSFTALELEPMRLPAAQTQSSFNTTVNDEIQAIVNLVQSSSVQSQIQSLQDFGTRFCLADNRYAVSQWIKDQFISFGITDVELHAFEWHGTTQYNVVATIPGHLYPDQFIIVGGHHDSINQYDDPYLIAPGADDNASGTVACLEMARVMMAAGYQPKRSIRFVTFAAEEFGLHGSRAYSRYAVENDLNIRLMINHDMISNNTSNPANGFVRLMPYEGSLDHSFHAYKITSAYTDLHAYYGEMNSTSSDSAPFWQAGYNVVYFFESDFSPYYHSSDDIVANIDPAYAAEVIKASTAVAATFAEMPETPSKLSVQDYGDGQSLLLTWDASPDQSVFHYRIYWGTDQYQLMNNHIDCQGNSYLLSGLTEGTEYLIAVAAVDTYDHESIGITGTGTPLVNPLTPAEFIDSPQRRSVQLSWQPNLEYDLAGYHIYRSTDANDPGSLLATMAAADTSYQDRDVYGGLHSYYYHICAFDHAGNLSPASEPIRSRPLTMNQGVLIIDETIGGSGYGIFQPTDQMIDQFYAELLEGYEPHLIDLEAFQELKLADLGIFSCVLWHGNDQADVSGASAYTDIIQKYIELGGKLLFSVYHPSTEFELNEGYPADFAPGKFIHDVLGIQAVDFTNQSRFKTALPLQADYPLIEVDPLKSLAVLNHHTTRIEGMTPTDAATAIYSYSSDYADDSAQGYLNGQAVGIRNDYGLGTAITLSFPLYFMDAANAKASVQHVFRHDFAELYPSEIDSNTPAARLNLSLPSPNPFSQSVSITLKAKDFGRTATLKIYNQRGQLVRTLLNDKPLNIEVFNWDARDENGKKVSSGVYYLQAKQGNYAVNEKIVYLK